MLSQKYLRYAISAVCHEQTRPQEMELEHPGRSCQSGQICVFYDDVFVMWCLRTQLMAACSHSSLL